MSKKDMLDQVARECIAAWIERQAFEWALGWLDAMKMTGSMSAECNDRLTCEVTAKYVESLRVVNHA